MAPHVEEFEKALDQAADIGARVGTAVAGYVVEYVLRAGPSTGVLTYRWKDDTGAERVLKAIVTDRDAAAQTFNDMLSAEVFTIPGPEEQPPENDDEGTPDTDTGRET